ncbi:MAG: hypothetical protein ACE5F1_11180 [Planctomycetota bacterium]
MAACWLSHWSSSRLPKPSAPTSRRSRKTVRENWSHLEHRGSDLDRLEKLALEELEKRPDRQGFLRALRRFVAGLEDGHAAVDVPEARTKGPKRWPFTVGSRFEHPE